MEQTTIYRHFFIFSIGTSFAIEARTIYVDIKIMEKDGFWINEKMEHTTGSTCKFWIPPGQLRYIEKIPPQPETEEA